MCRGTALPACQRRGKRAAALSRSDTYKTQQVESLCHDDCLMMSHPFTTTRLVEFVDTDAGRIMHFTSYLKYMEQVEHEMLRSLRLSVFTEVNEQTVSWPRVSTSFEYKRPAVFEDLMTIRMGVQRLGNKSVTYAAEFLRDDELLATGCIVAACCRVEDGQPPVAIQIPESIASRLQTMLIQAD